jgi:hypothetical protein
MLPDLTLQHGQLGSNGGLVRASDITHSLPTASAIAKLVARMPSSPLCRHETLFC